jgi:hypothetical protein
MLPALVLLIDRMSAIDLAYQVRAGDAFLDTGAVPRFDAWTFTVPGAPWLNQQWLAQVILAGVHRLDGWSSVWLLRGGLGSIAFGFLFLACRRNRVSHRAASLLSLAGFVAAFFNLGMRPQMLAVPVFSVCLWAIESWTERPRRLFLLPAAALFLANVHGSFPLIVLLGALTTFDAFLRRDRWRFALGVTALAFAVTFINPFGAAVWAYVADIAGNDEIRSAITEWAPLSVSMPSGVITLTSVLVLAVWFARRPTIVMWSALLWLGLFLLPALITQRSSVWWALVFPVVVSRLMAAPDPAAAVPVGGSRLPARIVVLALGAAMVVALPWFRGIPDDRMLDDAPPGLTAAVAAEIPAGTRLFVHQPWGSWFEYATPSIPVFVDSRIELFPDEVWDAYDQIAFDGAGWAEALDAYDVEAIVASADWDLLPRLEDDPGWRVVAEDDDGAVLVRA